MAEKKLTKKEEMDFIKKTLFTLDHVANALNTACLALGYVLGVKGDELDKVTSEELVKFTQEHMHPLIRRADEIVRETAKKLVDEEEPTKEEFENAEPADHVEPIKEEDGE